MSAESGKRPRRANDNNNNHERERSAEEWAAIAEARLARKEQHSKRKEGKINKHDPNCNRYKMVLSYEGLNFHGWQKQTLNGATLRTVEGVLEESLRPLLSQGVKFWPSGRTDAGVSATGQVAQFDAVVEDDGASLPAGAVTSWVETFNAALPSDVRCLSVATTHKSFAANECHWKRYVYRINGDGAAVLTGCLQMVGDPSWRNVAAGEPQAASPALASALDVDAMRSAARVLVGTHDFASFQSKGGRSTTVRTLHRCDVDLDGEGLRFTLEGEGFLYNMVRIIAGTLVQVGLGRGPANEHASGGIGEGGGGREDGGPEGSIRAILEATDRARAGPTAPAAGLCLEHVEYERPWGQ